MAGIGNVRQVSSSPGSTVGLPPVRAGIVTREPYTLNAATNLLKDPASYRRFVLARREARKTQILHVKAPNPQA